MKKSKHILSIIVAFFLTCTLNAQTNPSILDDKGQSCVYCVKDGQKHEHTNPYTINFRNELPYFATGIGLLGSGLILKSNNEKEGFALNEVNQLNANNVNSFDRGAIFNNSSSARTISDYLLLGSLVFPAYFLTNHHTRKDFSPLLIMGLEVLIINNSLTINAKYLFNRTRPSAYNTGFSDDARTSKDSRISFFSGHTSQVAGFSVFAAKVMTDYHPNMKKGIKIGVWSFALALPAVTGFLRVKGGKHFNTDVITGYAVGSIVGFLVPHLHKKKKLDSSLSLTPFNYDGASGLSLTLKL